MNITNSNQMKLQLGNKAIGIITAIAILAQASFSGCSNKKDTPQPPKPIGAKESSESFKLEKNADSKIHSLYIENFQRSINSCEKNKIKSFLTLIDDKQKNILDYLDNKEMLSLFKWYTDKVDLEYLDSYDFEGSRYIAFRATYYDNYYNDFNTPLLTGTKDVRAEFYKSVDEGIKKYADGMQRMDNKEQMDPMRSPGKHAKGSKWSASVANDTSSGASISSTGAELTNEELFEFEKEEATQTKIPKQTAHSGQNYSDLKSITAWISLLDSKVESKELKQFSNVIIAKVLDSSERTMLELKSVDLIKLFGSLPVFYGLDTTYSINDYDVFRNYLQFYDDLGSLEAEAFDQWKEIDEMETREFQESILDRVKNGKIDGKYDIREDLDAIRRLTYPKALQEIVSHYYNSDSTLTYYTALYEIPATRELVIKFRESTSIELIKQNSKDYTLHMILPDINGIYIEGKCWEMPNEKAIEYIAEKITDKEYKEQSLYTTASLQRDPSTEYGFNIIRDYMQSLVFDGTYSQVQNHLGLSYIFKSKRDKSGRLVLNGSVLDTGRKFNTD